MFAIFLVVIDGVSKSFGDVQALRDVSLEVERGEVVVVIGPSGSGKSILCWCINWLEAVDSGSITIDGVVFPEEGRALVWLWVDVGMVFQSFNLFLHKTVLQNVIFGPVKVRCFFRADARQRGMHLLERVGIADKAARYSAELSGGQQQRAAIAWALAMEPKLMLFDEPTSALDLEMIKEVFDVMEELAAEGTTMVVVSHEMGFACSVVWWVVFMDGGRIVEVAPLEQFFSLLASERARDFFSKILAH